MNPIITLPTPNKLYTVTHKGFDLTDALPKHVAEQKKQEYASLFSPVKIEEVKYGEHHSR